MADDRLNAQDWVAAGLRVLAEAGAGALKAEPMAKLLKVSRGSFYWHFADVEAFHTAVLARWQAVAYENIVADLEVLGEGRLDALIARAFSADTRMERAVRAWATSEPKARAMVQLVDARRVQYLRTALVSAGFEDQQAATRAQILYWAYLGNIFSSGKLTASARDDIARELAAFARRKGHRT